MPPVRQPAGGRRTRLLTLVALLIITFLVFRGAADFSFVNWDDDVNVTENPYVKDLSPQSIRQIFTTHVIGNYNPLTTLSFAVEYHFFGEQPKAYHITNILLHLFCTSFVFWLMLLLGMNTRGACIVALLFGIHPLRIESVAWITERKDVLFGFFYLLALIAYVLFLKKKKKRYFLLSLLFFVPSLLSKIQAVALPLTLLVVDYFMDRPLKVRLLYEKIPFFILSLIIGLVGMHFLKVMGSLSVNEVFTLVQRLFIGTYSLSVYLIKSIVPYQMSALYPYPKTIPVIYYLSPLFLAAVVYLVIRSARHTKDMVFGTLFFLVNVIFLLQVVGAGQGFIADRFTYIPYIGLFFVYARGFEYVVTKRKKIKALAYVVGIAYMIAMFTVSIIHIGVWKNSETLFTDVLKKHPNIPVAYNNRGRYYRTLNLRDKALADYNKAISLNPEGYATYNNRGKVYFDLNEDDKALADYNKALEIEPDYAEALANRGAVYGKKGDYDKSIRDLTRAVDIDSIHYNTYSNRALVYFNTEKYEQSIDDCNKFLKYEPSNADMINLRGLSKRMLNQFPEAIADYTLAIQLDPGQGAFFQNRSLAYFAFGDMGKALSDANQAEALGVKMNTAYLQRLRTSQ
jgi:Tfp pilus assembly protein PilF